MIGRSLFYLRRCRPSPSFCNYYENRVLFSSSALSKRLTVDPSTLVTGVTKERLDADPALADFFLANFPHAFARTERSAGDILSDDDDIDVSTILLNPAEAEAVKRYDEKVRLRKERAASEKTMVYERNIRPLTTYRRDPQRDEGTRNSKRLRYHEGMIPGLLYGGDPNLDIYSHQPESKIFLKTEWKVLQRELDRYRHNFESRVYKLTVKDNMEDDAEGRVHLVTPQNVQRHPLLETIYCANFLRYHPLRPLKIPIRYINVDESPALKRDAFMIPIQRFIECYVEDGADIPESIDLECAGLLMKQVARKDRLIIPDGVRMTKRTLKRGEDFIVGVVRGGLRGGDAEEGVAGDKPDDKSAGSNKQAANKPADNKQAADNKAGGGEKKQATSKPAKK
jgi:ribosomal protein L25 (general stress protein Ctc)